CCAACGNFPPWRESSPRTTPCGRRCGWWSRTAFSSARLPRCGTPNTSSPTSSGRCPPGCFRQRRTASPRRRLSCRRIFLWCSALRTSPCPPPSRPTGRCSGNKILQKKGRDAKLQSAPLFLYIEDNFLRIFRIDEQIVAAVPSALFEIFRVFPQQMLLHLLL